MVGPGSSTSALSRLGLFGCLLIFFGCAYAAPSALAGEPGPVAAYPFDEGAGESVEDFAGGHDGTTAGTEWVEGEIGDSLRFSGAGSGSCVTIPDGEALGLESHFTFEAWVRTGGSQYEQPVITMEGTPGTNTYELEAGTTVDGPVGIVEGESGTARVRSEPPLPVDAWTHLAFTSDGSKLRLYVDGELARPPTASTTSGKSQGPIRIGCYGGRTFNGRIDEVRIYQRTLSAGEIATDMATGILTQPTSGPMAQYLLNEGQGTVAGDPYGGHEGTIENGTWTEGKYGFASQFNGSTSCLTVPGAPNLELLNGFTVEAWVQITGGPGGPFVVMEDPSPPKANQVHYYWEMSAYTEIGPYATVRKAKASTGEVVSLSGVENTIPVGTWTHIALTYDGSDLRLYDGGELLQRVSAAGQEWARGPLRIGCYFAGNPSTFHFNGKIDEVRLYNHALPVGQIEADERNDFTPPEIELSGPLTEGLKEGTTEYPLHVHATDGKAGFPGVGVKSITISVDGQVVDHVEQACPAGSCPMDREWVFDTQTFPGLLHRVTVEAEDLAGNVSSSTLEPVVTTTYAVEAANGEQTSVTGRINEQEPNGNLVVRLNAVTFGEPESVEGATAQAAAEEPPKRRRAYRFTECSWDTAGLGLGSEIPVGKLAELQEEVALLAKEQAEAQGSSQQCHGELETGLGQKVTVRWAVSASGLFFYRQGSVVWVEEKPDCKQWGPKAPADWTDCKTAGNLSTEHLDIIGDWRWAPGSFSPGFVPLSAVCARLNGVLPVNPPKQENGELVIHESMHFHYWPVERHGEEEPPCDWEHPRHVSGY